MSRLAAFLFRTPGEAGVFRRMANENFRRYRSQYAIAIVCLLFSAGATAYSAWLMGPIVKDVFYGNDMNRALVLAATVAGIFLVKGIVTYFQSVILSKIGNSLVANYQRRLFDHMLRLGVDFFSRQHSVDLISRLNQNVIAVRDLLNTVVLGFVRDLVTLLGLIFVMFYRDPYMSLAVFVIGPIALIAIAGYARRVKRIAREEVKITAQVATSMQEAAHGIEVVKAMTMEDQMRAKLNMLTVEAEKRSNQIARITARSSPLMETLAGFAVAGVIAYGGYRVINHGYAPSDLTSFMTALLLAYEPAKRLARMRVSLERSLVNARMIYEVLDTPIRQADKGDAKPLDLKAGTILFDKVSFHYETNAQNEAQSVLTNLSFEALAGQTTALVGPSGGGKSTIIALLQRFYDPASGTITIDGQDLTGLQVASVRSAIAYVSQQPILFQGTVIENLRYARPEATDAEIEEACRAAQAHDFIMQLAEGYDTLLGENGANLSGGQRQRLSIARAIVRNAPILLLDEATSALDNESEAQVQQALDTLMQGRTSIVVAHRLSTIEKADRIVVIDKGRAVDAGTHDELMKAGGIYARLQSVAGGKGLPGPSKRRKRTAKAG
ncbi:ABC transporter ATP-binding protein [Pseudahrensia aquimaris]|uniref:ABC transporter ATP-binding protein n=1 Tax=Pseudahrensia aquimaris TaxID=744461 RepID=A0ABW3FHI8_9HYPH